MLYFKLSIPPSQNERSCSRKRLGHPWRGWFTCSAYKTLPLMTLTGVLVYPGRPLWSVKAYSFILKFSSFYPKSSSITEDTILKAYKGQ
jgi:hypothetical protein